jgi:polyphenol oxidase
MPSPILECAHGTAARGLAASRGTDPIRWRFEQSGTGSDIVVAFSGRDGGVSGSPFGTANISGRVGDAAAAVHTNRELLLARLEITDCRVVTVRQQHGADVVRVGNGTGGASADGMVTADAGLALVIGVSDCAPVAYVDMERRVIGALHVGWRGLVGGIVEAGAGAMLALGAQKGTLQAIVGPCICCDCYPVAEEVRSLVARHYPTAAAVDRTGAPAVELRAGIEQALAAAQVRSVTHVHECTAESAAYFSARRDGRTGCQAAIVAITERSAPDSPKGQFGVA